MSLPFLSPQAGPDSPPFLEFAPRPVPTDALERLHQEARGRGGGAQAARSLLFWLGGEKDPTGYAGSGGLELQRLDARNRQAALDVINWWAFPENSDLLFDVLESIGKEFAMTDPPCASAPGTEPTPFLPPRPNAPGGLP